MVLILVLLLILALCGGIWAGPTYGPYWGWSPLGVLIIAVFILILTGNLKF